MTTRYPDAIKVPHLKQKLGAIYIFGRGIDGDAAMGLRFASDAEPKGITGKAIRNWIYGEGAREECMVPAVRFKRFVQIFREQLPGSRDEAETTALLLSANLQDFLVALISVGPQVHWTQLMLDASTTSVALIPAPRPGVLRLTRRPRQNQPNDGQVEHPVGQMFRLQARSPAYGWISLIQWGRNGCFAVELVDGSASLQVPEGAVIVPPSRPYFVEDEIGPRRFLFLTSQVPLPPDMASRLATSALTPAPLDVGTLDRLAHLAGAENGFSLSALDVLFVDASA